MSEEIKPEVEATPDRIAEACAIARGEKQPDPDAEGFRVVGAKKDKNARGNGPEWYRMVYRGGAWRYVSDEALPQKNFLASDRRATVYGEVFLGEICADHDRGSPVTDVFLICPPDADGIPLEDCEFKKTRDGSLKVTLPDGSTIKVPDPRKK